MLSVGSHWVVFKVRETVMALADSPFDWRSPVSISHLLALKPSSKSLVLDRRLDYRCFDLICSTQ